MQIFQFLSKLFRSWCETWLLPLLLWTTYWNGGSRTVHKLAPLSWLFLMLYYISLLKDNKLSALLPEVYASSTIKNMCRIKVWIEIKKRQNMYIFIQCITTVFIARRPSGQIACMEFGFGLLSVKQHCKMYMFAVPFCNWLCTACLQDKGLILR